MEPLSLPDPPSQRRSSGDAAAQYIRTLIFDGHLHPGARVPQDDVAEALGISRIPVREALIALGQQGWVTIAPNRGAFVTAFDERAVRDHYELYGLVYGFAAKKALERSGAVLGEKLSQLARDYSNTSEPAEAQRIALAFHAGVVEAACSPRIDVAVPRRRRSCRETSTSWFRMRSGGSAWVSPPSRGRANGATANKLPTSTRK